MGRKSRNALPILAAYLGHTDWRYTIKYLKVINAGHGEVLIDFCVILARQAERFWNGGFRFQTGRPEALCFQQSDQAQPADGKGAVVFFTLPVSEEEG